MNPSDVYNRGLSNPDALTPDERLVYLVQELKTLADMEGWDHFFRYDYVYHLVELKDRLRRVGDTDSLAVLDDYEQRLRLQGVAMEPEAVSVFLASQNAVSFENDRDWREEFSNASEARWDKIGAYLRDQGHEVVWR